MKRSLLAACALLVVLTLLAPLALAASSWRTTATVPTAFKPGRTVAFSFTASSQNAADLPAQWDVQLWTCQDADANTYCASTEPHFTDWGVKPISLVAGQSGTLTWQVTLNQPEGAYRYHFETRCNEPCATEPGGGDHNKTGAFTLRYTNSWTRTIQTTNPTSAGATQSVSYTMTSTSLDDRDLAGAAELFSTPPSQPEASQGEKPYTATANTQVAVTWTGVSFPTIGTHRLRVTDTNAPDSALDVTVRGVHLHVTQPRETYTQGARFSLYVTLHGHGNPTDPEPILDDVTVTLTNGAFVLHKTTLSTSANGTTYYSFQGADDLQNVTWIATTTGSWDGIAYDLAANGTVHFVTGGLAAVAENVTAVRADLDQLQFEGVHLDDLGARHVFLLAARAAGAVGLLLGLILVVFIVATRI